MIESAKLIIYPENTNHLDEFSTLTTHVAKSDNRLRPGYVNKYPPVINREEPRGENPLQTGGLNGNIIELTMFVQYILFD